MSFLLGTSVNISFIPALAFTRYAFDREINSGSKFQTNSSAVTSARKVFAVGLSSLPRNRKETRFLRFLIKLIKVFASQRSERLGVRIRFKGRVNR